ncbi:RING-H2 finger ATL79-like [Olea europaea subsp. europaea]|uniref:RING-type E3 ubiquitin transferase n=1 Tax=Olea europaea subsp. europaea TaxID=158383 RepID=A0A8S0PMI5_OLEEU|nr:RING-H2 finger ATL79-like [Olea europaea subsp. europaea]
MKPAFISSRFAPLPLRPPPPLPRPEKCEGHKCPWWPYSSSKEFKANSVMILMVLLCGLITALAFNAGIRYIIRLHCRRRRSQQPPVNEDVEMAHPKTEEEEIPTVIYSPGMKLAGAEAECVICLSEFSDGEKVRVLEKCNHGFHVQCVQKWLLSHSSCPTCRTNCSG